MGISIGRPFGYALALYLTLNFCLNLLFLASLANVSHSSFTSLFTWENILGGLFFPAILSTSGLTMFTGMTLITDFGMQAYFGTFGLLLVLPPILSAAIAGRYSNGEVKSAVLSWMLVPIIISGIDIILFFTMGETIISAMLVGGMLGGSTSVFLVLTCLLGGLSTGLLWSLIAVALAMSPASLASLAPRNKFRHNF